MNSVRVILLLGSNLGDRLNNFLKAINLIQERVGNVLRKSSVYETEPWQMNSSLRFLNQALMIQTSLTASETMNKLKVIEREMGRTSTLHYTDRIIDLDIAFWGTEVIEEKDLQIPHPRIHLRKFALVPLEELDPLWIHPTLNCTVQELLRSCQDISNVELFRHA
ncbi:MAG: 2-amino-4-hydroxy-6-hydroxymethyldihydropteridine diphosphokinase [Saprospiraceae bacterium]